MNIRNKKSSSGRNALYDDTSYQPHNPQYVNQSQIFNPAEFNAPPQSTAPSMGDHDFASYAFPTNNQFGAPNQNAFLDPNALASNPAAQFAVQYGQNLAEHGQKALNERVERFMSITKLKHYFAVDTNYVVKKMKILLLPIIHNNWAVTYNQNEPVAPRYDVNTPDLYIPCMAFITYILIAGVCLGTRDEFSPESLGVLSSSAMAWFSLELLLVYVASFIFSVNSSIVSFIDFIAYCGYKFLPMLLVLSASLVGGRLGFYATYLYTSFMICYFLVKTLRLTILTVPSFNSAPGNPAGYDPYSGNAPAMDSTAHGQKRRWYFLLSVSLSQPFFIYLLTYSLAAY